MYQVVLSNRTEFVGLPAQECLSRRLRQWLPCVAARAEAQKALFESAANGSERPGEGGIRTLGTLLRYSALAKRSTIL